MSLAYSICLKRIVALDVGAIAALFCLRAIAGCLLAGTAVPVPFLACVALTALNLGLAKRYAELIGCGSVLTVAGRGYRPGHASILPVAGICSAALSVLCLAIFGGSFVDEHFRNPALIILSSALQLGLFWRVWVGARNPGFDGDPIRLAVQDPLIAGGLLAVSLGVAVAVAAPV
ncbi:hypothetical protein [Breoghania sp. L-A4]|uniref:hypothetical protein n=1 Tax=Breoghania sp. L-A4 TaxID=2304600 RepID=UPI000E3609ED|nr:hypothetical protein [Breoghania sp. L-A4]AXS42014.1 hypothetical protein D1F64_20910 [Breoghania sp. L-A4]